MSANMVKIEDGLETTKSVSEEGPRPDIGSSTGNAGGVFYGRDLSRTGTGRARISRSRTRDSYIDAEEGDDWHMDDWKKKKQVFRGRTLLW
jgi:KUP system potassium uptake protein